MAVDLEQALAELAGSLEFPGEAALASRVVADLDRPAEVIPLARRPAVRRFLALAAAAIVVAGVVLVASPRAREAVADLLGIGGIEIQSGDPGLPTSVPATFPTSTMAPPTTTAPPPTAGGSTNVTAVPSGPVSVDEGAAALGIPPPIPPALGPPESATFDDGRLSLQWAPSPTLPPTGLPGVGALLTVFRAEIEEPLFRKTLEPGTTYERVRVNGGASVWLAGEPHLFLYLDRNGEIQEETLRLAGDTLIWSDGPFTYRLESALARDAAIALAESIGTG